MGLKTEKTLYLAVWNLEGKKEVTIPLEGVRIADACVAYPRSMPIDFSYTDNAVTLHFTQDIQARIFKISLAE